MPIYEYNCEKCGKFEFLHGVGEGALALCPKCGSPVRRLIPSRMGIAFHGSGFYVTDHRSEDYKREARKDGESSGSAS
ncbi:MAG: zinc ribbon domain-containing protein [Firmicutes bacterium]|nr:zinc ribbon domain-containing protein [Bacillota bacterium]MDD4337747.1 zinc ribbon domain-containing protein [Bacillota bacterium]